MVDSRKCKNVILVYKVLPTKKKKLRIYIEKSLNKKETHRHIQIKTCTTTNEINT